MDVDEHRQQRGVLAEGLAVVAIGAPQVIGQEAGQAVAEGVIGIVADELDVDLGPRLAGSLLAHGQLPGQDAAGDGGIGVDGVRDVVRVGGCLIPRSGPAPRVREADR